MKETFKYRPDIDGLRAIAILLVVIFHAFPKLCPGGFTGVSVFFVISGYLISGIILRDLFTGRFSLLEFYARRFRRIVPALAVVLVATWVAGRYLLWADEFKSLGTHVFNSAFFTENIRLSNETNYFDVAADFKPLLHFWSLGIEEQFYLVWPLVLWLTYRRKSFWQGIVLVGLGVASLVYKLSEADQTSVKVFYLLPARFWELMLGGALAYLEVRKIRVFTKWPKWSYSAISAVALLVVMVFAFWFDPKRSNAKWYMAMSTLVPTWATFAIMAVGERGWAGSNLLSLRGLIWVGKISYPLYLWHWVILSLLRIRYNHVSDVPPPAWACALAVGVAVVLSWLTYRLIELPAQKKLFVRWPERKRNWGYVVSALGVLTVVGLTGLATKKGKLLTVEQKRQEKLLDAYGKFKFNDPELGRAYRDECNLHARKIIEPSCYTPTSETRVFIWGDSHAQHLNYGLSKYLSKDISLLQIAASQCEPSIKNDKGDSCNRWNEFALSHIRATKPIVVVLAQDKGHEKTAWDEVARKLKELGVKHVVLVGPVPQWHPDLYQIIARNYLDNIPRRLKTGTKQESFNTDLVLQFRYSSSTELTYISLVDRLCEKDGCLTLAGSDVLTDLISIDYGHFSLTASKFVAENFVGPVVTGLIR